MNKRILLLVFCVQGISCGYSQSKTVHGIWRTFDDNDGRLKSEVKIYEENGKTFGKVIKLYRLPDEDQDPICDLCEDYRKDQKVMGMIIMEDMELDDDEYKNGTICDPKNGKIYTCKMWLEDENTLKVRGYIAFLFRTQTWRRLKGT